MEPIVGEIKLFAGNFAPQDWALCQGQTLPINQYQKLFSIIGTTYGGDGRNTFALPDLRDSVPVGNSQNLQLGDKGGNVEVSPPLRDSPQKPVKTQRTLALTYIIALDGVYPSRG